MNRIISLIFIITFTNIYSQKILDNKYVVRTDQSYKVLNGEMVDKNNTKLIIRKIVFDDNSVDYGDYTLDSLEIQTVRFGYRILKVEPDYTTVLMYNKNIKKEFKVITTIHKPKYIYLLREGVNELIYF